MGLGVVIVSTGIGAARGLGFRVVSKVLQAFVVFYKALIGIITSNKGALNGCLFRSCAKNIWLTGVWGSDVWVRFFHIKMRGIL